jgi:hypothetical protein
VGALREGRVVRLEIFANRQKALESVGAGQTDGSGRIG